MNGDRPILGVLLMIGFCAVVPVSDAVAKLLGERLPLITLVFARFFAQGALALPFAWRGGRGLRLPGRVWRLILVRTCLHITAMTAMYAAFVHMPLADAIAIVFVMPFMMMLLGWAFLGEEVGRKRLLACGVGFAGTLLVVQPSFAEVGYYALLPLVVAVAFAFYMVLTRLITRDTDPLAVQVIGGFSALPLLLAGSVILGGAGYSEFSVSIPDGGDGVLLAFGAVLGAVATLFLTWSLRLAPSTAVAPLQYLEIPFATLVGWLVFGDLPDGLAAVGIVITMATGLYVIFQERGAGAPAGAER